MDLTKYMFKRLIHYLVSMVVMMIIYVAVVYGGGRMPNEVVQGICISAILFGYPAYRLIRSVVMVIADYYDEEIELSVNLFALCWELLMPEFFKGSRRRVFFMNMLSKLLQMCGLGILVYAFISGEYRLFRIMVVLTVVGFAVAMYLLIRLPAGNHSRLKRAEREELLEARAATDFPPDGNGIKAFMKTPKRVLAGDFALVVLGALLILIYPQTGVTIVQALVGFFKTAGFVALLGLPFCIMYYLDQRHVSYSYTLRLGKGEYGQIKIDYFEYDGWGDDRSDTRHIIDRVDDVDLGARYIKVQQTAQLLPVKIPRTFENESKLLDTLKIMRY